MSHEQTLQAGTVAPKTLYGLMAVFDDAEALIEAARGVRAQGYDAFDAFTPFAVDELPEAMELPPDGVAPICWLGGLLGAATAFCWQSYDSLVRFTLNSGGRPLFSWPSFVPISFELMVLFAGVSTFFAVIGLNRLPRYHHPVFNIDEFQRRNSSDGYFLVIEAADRKFDRARTLELLHSFGPARVYEVPHEP